MSQKEIPETQEPQNFQLHFKIFMADGTIANGHTDVPHLENIIADLITKQHPTVRFRQNGEKCVQFERIQHVAGAPIEDGNDFVLSNDAEYAQKLNLRMRRAVMESEEKWMERASKIPHINFPADWGVKVIPPFGNALVRFRVSLPDGSEKSVYLDDQCALGFFGGTGSAYWEVYPVESDVGRCALNDTAELIRLIGAPR